LALYPSLRGGFPSPKSISNTAINNQTTNNNIISFII
jgi:hypothetical protein